jgi:hypothetical protein
LMLSRIRSDESGIEQESFLIEARSLSGYSGSPVFVYRMPYGAVLGDDEIPGGGLQDIRKHKLLGVDWAHLRDFRPVLLSDKKTKATDDDGNPLYVEQNSGMVAVVPSWRLLELLDEEELVRARKQASEQIRGDSDYVALDVEGESEFERFEGLTRQLVNTPKPKAGEEDESAQ